MDWQAAEREYTNEVIGETTIPELFFDSVERNASRNAQLYKGGVHDRSLTPDIVPEPPAGEYRGDRKSTRLNSSHIQKSRMPSSA